MKLLFLIMLVACSTNKSKKIVEQVEILKTNKVNLVNVTKLRNFTKKEEIKLHKYIKVMNETIASKCFFNFINSRKIIKTNSLKNSEVINMLRTYNVKIELEMYYKRWSKVSGYTEPNVSWIKLNRKFHTGASLCSEASNLAHELSHKLGFGHSYRATKQRPFSVPYSINEGFKKCCL